MTAQPQPELLADGAPLRAENGCAPLGEGASPGVPPALRAVADAAHSDEASPGREAQADARARVLADPVAALDEVVATLDALTGATWHEVPGQAAHDALDRVEQAARRLTAVRSQVVSVVESNGLWALGGSRTFAAWLRTRTASTAGAASRQVRESRALRDHLPLTRQALAAGTISADHAGVLVREATRTQQLRAQLAHPQVGEAFLVEQAEAMDAGTFTTLVRSWATAADPEGADRAWRETGAKEELTISPTTGGYHLAGWLDELSGQLVNEALKAHAGRKGADDQRTAAQRRAAALVSVCRQSLDAGAQGASARVRPHVTVTVSLEMLRALAAATGSSVPPRQRDGEPHPAGAAFGAPADTALSATGGPRDPNASDDPKTPGSAGGTHATGGTEINETGGPESSGADAPRATGGVQHDGTPGPVQVPGAQDAGAFELSPTARKWAQAWRPGQDHVISTAIDHEALRGIAPATLEDGTPIPPALLARLTCESALSRVVFGPESTILDAGREKRIFPANQAKAIIARDRTCRYPGCDEPPGFGEIHHSLWWAKHHGPTDADKGILLCWHHHDWVHAHQITITRSQGKWSFRDRHGWLITARSRDGDDEPPPTS